MTPETSAIIQEFAVAHRTAQDNPQRLIDDYAGNLDDCIRRMARVRNADAALFALAGQPELPVLVQDFLAAEADKGCVRCWMSSKFSKAHADCKEKIGRWFAAREALVHFGVELSLAPEVPS